MGCIKMKGEMIRYGNRGDLGLLKGYDTHISGEELGNALEQGMVLTSTLSSEGAQHFYRKRGYVDCGSLLLPGEPLEIILRKELGE